MKYVKTKRALDVIHRLYPEAGNITITQAFKERYGWLDLASVRRYGYPLRDLPRLRDEGFTSVQLRLIDRNGTVRFPDYRMEEFEEEFRWEPGDQLTVSVNQGERDAVILAVVGNEALLEYEMPGGTTALWVIDAGIPRPGCKRNVAYKTCPKKWVKAIEDAGLVWEGRGQ